jgi:hypothetical protein
MVQQLSSSESVSRNRQLSRNALNNCREEKLPHPVAISALVFVMAKELDVVILFWSAEIVAYQME